PQNCKGPRARPKGSFPAVLIRCSTDHHRFGKCRYYRGVPQRMHFPNFVSFGVALGLLAAAAFAQNCRPGSIELDVNIQCACVKSPDSPQCELYKRNKSMYDGKGIQLWQGAVGTQQTATSPYRVSQPSAPLQRTPVSPTLLPPD